MNAGTSLPVLFLLAVIVTVSQIVVLNLAFPCAEGNNYGRPAEPNYHCRSKGMLLKCMLMSKHCRMWSFRAGALFIP